MFWLAFKSGYCSETIIRRLNVPARAFGGNQIFHGAGIAGIRGGGLRGGVGDVARLGDILQRLALVLDVALGDFDEVRNQVVAALELHVNLRVGVFVAVAHRDEFVVNADDEADQAQQHHQQHDCHNQSESNCHNFPLLSLLNN